MVILIAISVGSALVAALAVHLMGRHQLVKASRSQQLALKCSHCGLLVARFEQRPDSSISCANCTRQESKK